MLASLISILAAILVYIPINAFMSMDTQIMLGEEIVFPLVKLFANAMLMIGAPVTFFSLLKNFTDIYIISERNASGRRLQIKTIITSVIAVVLAIVAGLIIAAILSSGLGDIAGYGGLDSRPSVRELIESIVPSSIFTPFETIMPFPLIFVALIVTYAFCSIGKYFDKTQKAVEVCYALFSRMLHVVMFAFPFFCFLALLKENYKIGSVIDAVPFNVRFCVKNYGMDRKRITDKFSILAQIN